MRITVCEMPHAPAALDNSWSALCEHAAAKSPDLVLLPELATIEPVWELEYFNNTRWQAVESLNEHWLDRLGEIGAEFIVGTRAVSVAGQRLNQAYLWSKRCGLLPLRSKYFLPDEAGSWETTWFSHGDAGFPAFRAGDAIFGVNICSELWALETYGAYAALGVDLLLSPRATAATTRDKWRAVGVVSAVRSGAFSVSSNRVDDTGACGGGGWIIDPNGRVLATTSAGEPFATIDVDLSQSAEAKTTYPRYVFSNLDARVRSP